MWTLMDSPVGELRIVERDGMITAIEVFPFRASTEPSASGSWNAMPPPHVGASQAKTSRPDIVNALVSRGVVRSRAPG